MVETSGSKKIVFSVMFAGLLLAVTALLLASLELTLSFFVARPSDSMERSFRLNHTWPAGKSRDLQSPEPEAWPGYQHRYNKQSWIEDYDVEPNKPSGVYRIFYVGDSFTEGLVPMERSVASQLETELNRRFNDSGQRFEVINTGTSSYSPLIYSILIRDFISKYDPDVVVINVDMTDNFDDWKYRRTAIFGDDGLPYAAPGRNIYDDVFVQSKEGVRKANWYSRLNLYLFHNSYLYNWLMQSRILQSMAKNAQTDQRDRAERDKDPNIYNTFSWCEHEWDEQIEENVAFTRKLLAGIFAYGKSNGVKIVLTGVPHHQQFTPDAKHGTLWSLRPLRELEAATRAGEGIYIDSHAGLKPHIQGSPWTRYYYRSNMHFNPDGNDLWAQVHIDAFLNPANGLLPKGLQ